MPLYFWSWEGRWRPGRKKTFFYSPRTQDGDHLGKEGQKPWWKREIFNLPLLFPFLLSSVPLYLPTACLDLDLCPLREAEKGNGRSTSSIDAFMCIVTFNPVSNLGLLCLSQIYICRNRLKAERKPAITRECMYLTPNKLIFLYMGRGIFHACATGVAGEEEDSVISQWREKERWEIMNLIVRKRGRGFVYVLYVCM